MSLTHLTMALMRQTLSGNTLPASWTAVPLCGDGLLGLGDWARVVCADSGASLGEGRVSGFLSRMPALPDGADGSQYRIGLDWVDACVDTSWSAALVRGLLPGGKWGDLIPSFPACPDCGARDYAVSEALRLCACGSLFALSPRAVIPFHLPDKRRRS